MAGEGVEDVATQDEEGCAHEPLHDGVDTLGQPLRQDDGREPEQEHDEGMAERVQRCEPHRTSRFFLRARDVGERGDVVPVDAVAKAEAECGQKEAEVKGIVYADCRHERRHRCPPHRHSPSLVFAPPARMDVVCSDC